MPAAYTPLFNKCQRHTHRYSTNVSGIHRYSTQVILTVSFGSSAGRVHLLHQRPLKTKRRWRRRQFWRRRLFDDEFYSHDHAGCKQITQRLTRSTYASSIQPCFRFQSLAWASNKSCRSRLDRPSPNAVSINSENSMSYQYSIPLMTYTPLAISPCMRMDQRW